MVTDVCRYFCMSFFCPEPSVYRTYNSTSTKVRGWSVDTRSWKRHSLTCDVLRLKVECFGVEQREKLVRPDVSGYEQIRDPVNRNGFGKSFESMFQKVLCHRGTHYLHG